MNLCEVSRDLGVESWVKLNAAFSRENHISKSAAQEGGVGTVLGTQTHQAHRAPGHC